MAICTSSVVTRPCSIISSSFGSTDSIFSGRSTAETSHQDYEQEVQGHLRTATEPHLCISRVYTHPRLGKVGTLIGHSTLGKEAVSNESVQKPGLGLAFPPWSHPSVYGKEDHRRIFETIVAVHPLPS